ncbi:hypothetical protein HGRIS_010877 [Hohenbuehelia grisea]|uniref:F-box domain-containing protein n=1 Tax=Hohenbuehelia grisea TaxID=104357 RepID=A0ABR3IYE1_9AGAR
MNTEPAIERVPFEVWLYISEFFHSTASLRWSLFNRSFFNIYLDRVYRDISWTQLDNKMIQSLVRTRDPFIARRVQKLHISLWFLKDLAQRDARQSSFSTSHRANWFSLWPVLRPSPKPVARPLEAFESDKSLTDYKRNLVKGTAQHVLDAMIAAIIGMSHVFEFPLEHRDAPPTFQPFLTTAWTSFSVNLQKLVIHTRIASSNTSWLPLSSPNSSSAA